MFGAESLMWLRNVPELDPTSCKYHWPFDDHIFAWFRLTTFDLKTIALGCSCKSRSVCLPTTNISPSSTLRSIGSNRRGRWVKESIAGTIRIEILLFAAGDAVAAVAEVGTGVVAMGADGAWREGDSVRRRVPFCAARTWTSRFIGVWPRLSRNVAESGGAWPASFALITPAPPLVVLPPPATELPMLVPVPCIECGNFPVLDELSKDSFTSERKPTKAMRVRKWSFLLQWGWIFVLQFEWR